MKTTRVTFVGVMLATLGLSLLAPPEAQGQVLAQFFSDLQRAKAGETITFYDLSSGNIFRRDWVWGDGTTDSFVAVTEPTHIYFPVVPLPATFDVSLTVVEPGTGTQSSITKPDWITVVAAPFARYTADVFIGGAPLAVSFTDMSEGDGVTGPPAWLTWEWGDGTADTAGLPADVQNSQHEFLGPGIFDVTLTVIFQNASTDSETRQILVGQGTPGEETPPSSTITFTDLVRDEECLLALCAAEPLVHWHMVWDAEDRPATRLMVDMQFNIKNDPKAADRPYDNDGIHNYGGLHPHDIYQYVVVKDQPEEVDNHLEFDAGDFVITTPADFNWQRDPLPAPPIFIPQGTKLQIDRDGWLVDEFNFPSTNPPLNINLSAGVVLPPASPIPYDLFVEPWHMVTSGNGNDYILAVRTSAQWHNGLTIAYDVTSITIVDLMVQPTGPRPTGPEGGWLDLIDPLDEAPLDPETTYLASFTAWDTTIGSPSYARGTGNVNVWTWPTRLYTPLTEHRRPRWDVPGQAFDFVSGEWVELRKMLPIDQWTDVIGINLHATTKNPDLFPDPPPALVEVNVVLTDENGSPYDIQFNPRTGLETMTTSAWFPNSDPNLASGVDFTWNGVWTWFDTNNNGVFDPPAVDVGGSASLTDHPLWPDMAYYGGEPGQSNIGLPQWEYIPFPPGGGPPWWKIKLFHSESGHRAGGGLIEPTPETPGSSTYCDFFVVVRPDSGFDDSSQTSGDGTGIRHGATFRSFIEPRRFNARTGFEDGGIYTNTQLPSRTSYNPFTGDVTSAWQNDFRWDEFNAQEPWWPERTTNHNATKPVRVAGVDIHDYALTYETNNLYARNTDIWYGLSSLWPDGPDGMGMGSPRTQGTNILTPDLTWWGQWLDPYWLDANRFYDFMTVMTQREVRLFANHGVDEDNMTFGVHYPYESVPFYNEEFDAPSNYGPRSPFLPVPPTQPEMPTFTTWPITSAQGDYPREAQWLAANRRARYLKQHIEPMSRPTVLLGFNFAAADDPVVNQTNRLWLHEVTIAFWGTDFDPSDLLELDEDGTSNNSGVLLVEDTSADGVFGTELWQTATSAFALDALDWDSPAALNDLAWKLFPEYVDVTGDGVADDMNGDGLVDTKDRAWILRMKLRDAWPVPVIDDAGGGYTGYDEGGKDAGGAASKAVVSAVREAAQAETGSESPAATKSQNQTRPNPSDPTGHWTKKPQRAVASALGMLQAATRASATKAIGPVGSMGDDLFLVIRTSETLSRFEQFRAFVPVFTNARLPGAQPGGEQPAGFNFTPQVPVSQHIYKKFHPEEGPVQEFYGPEPYGMDMLEANVYCDISDLLSSGQTIFANSGPVGALGIDLSTNRGNAIGKVAQGLSGSGSAGPPPSFSVPVGSWAAGAAFTGCFLIDEEYEAYEITGNNATTLFLLSGTPRNGPWFIAQDPTFLEQIIVELYDNDRDGRFDLLEDLLPLSIDQTVSGLAIYRDNDNDPANRNGLFDPAVDIPIALDYAPFQIGMVGEPDNQVMFVFSTPGTDEVPIPRANQTRHRHVIPETLGDALGDPELGPDFFVIFRTSNNIDVDDDFRVAVVSSGPNTPTEPDPDTFPPPPTSRVGEFDIFSEFPWGYRAIGLITVFRSAPDGSPLSDPWATPVEGYYARGYPEPDNSGFNWVRSTVNKSEQTATITASDAGNTSDSLTITSVNPAVLGRTTVAAGVTLDITGTGFGTAPTVVLDGFTLTVNSATDTLIQVLIPGGTLLDADLDGVVILTVANALTGRMGQFDGFTLINGDPALMSPNVVGVSPNRGGQADFPVAVLGSNFDDPEVRFGLTIVPVQSWSPTRIDVGFPVGGLAATGALDVTVTNQGAKLSDTLPDGFTYVNLPGGGGRSLGLPSPPCFIATAAYGTPFAERLDTFRSFRDGVLLKTAGGTALVDAYYTMSPALADQVAVHPWLAATVRAALTPVAWALAWPGWAAGIVAGMMAMTLFRRRRIAACRIL